MLALKLFVLAAFIGSLIWSFADPGYQSITAVIISAGSLLAIRVNQRAQRYKHTFKPKKTPGSS